MSANVRMRLDHDEFMSLEIRPFVRMFLCGVHGVLLRRRGPGDDHVVFEVICEDDEYWFPGSAGGSSYWLPHLMGALVEARRWCGRKCLPDPEGSGYMFKPGTVEQKPKTRKRKSEI